MKETILRVQFTTGRIYYFTVDYFKIHKNYLLFESEGKIFQISLNQIENFGLKQSESEE